MALWGYSGGAFATQFTAELAAEYAPDLKIAGAVVGGPAPNLTTVDQLMNAKDTAGLVVASIMGTTSQDTAAQLWLWDHLKKDGPYNATWFYAALWMTGIGALEAYSQQDIANYFVNGSQDLWGPELRSLFDRTSFMGHHGTPNMPVFIYKAIQDEMSPVTETDNLVQTMCASGANVLYHRNTLGTHNVELWSGRMRTMDFIAAMLGTDVNQTAVAELGIPATGCNTINVTIPVNMTMVYEGLTRPTPTLT
jgi:hypothetical protein